MIQTTVTCDVVEEAGAEERRFELSPASSYGLEVSMIVYAVGDRYPELDEIKTGDMFRVTIEKIDA